MPSALALAHRPSSRPAAAKPALGAPCWRIAAFALAFLAALFTATPTAHAQGGIIRDSEIEEMLRDFATPIWRAANLNVDSIDIYIINDPSLNAFVAGGENIFVHTGLILAAENPNQLIGVLAHESGHIAGGHLARSREAMRRSMGPALISIGLGVIAIAAGAPDAGSTLIAGSGAVAQGNFVRHTQVQESAADQAAVSYLDASGQSATGLLDFFNRQFRRYEFDMRRAPPYMLTHPLTSDRVQALRERVQGAQHYQARDNARDVHRLAMAQAKLYGFLMTPPQTLNRYPLSDRSAPARYARAVAYYRAVNIPQALAEIRSLIAEEPDNAFFHELHGQILFENARSAEAIPAYRRSVELRPNDSLLIVGLARALAASERRAGPATAEAMRLLERATQLENDNAFAWRELASVHDSRRESALAQLASAEAAYSVHDFARARVFAERARRELTAGEPAYQRAVDISTFAAAETPRNESGSRRRRPGS